MPVPEPLKQYAMQLGFPDSDTIGRIFEILYPHEDDLKLISALPGTVDEIAERTGFSREKIKKIADKLMSRGALSHPMNKPEWLRLFPVFIELRDANVITWRDAPQELFELWDKIIYTEVPKLVPLLKGSNLNPLVRVVPIERTVESQSTVLDIDSVRKIFKDAELITAVPCACRTQSKRVGKGDKCHAPADVHLCMQINGFAKPLVEKGLAAPIKNADALKRISIAEDAGLVHVVRNNYKKDMFMCNCCSCCCVGLNYINNLDYTGAYAPSRFRVKLNADACSGCGICADRCQFKAIKVNDVAEISLDRCFGCGNCVITCPDEALSLEEIRPKEHIRIS